MVNIDVPDLARALAFYQGAFGLSVTRRFGASGAELQGWPARLDLLEKRAGATLDDPPRDEVWGRIAGLADPFGPGLCLVEFQNRGYDEISERA